MWPFPTNPAETPRPKVQDTPPTLMPPENVRQTSPGTHLAVITAILLPFALLPYMSLRRQLGMLHRRVDEVAGTSRALHHHLKSTLQQTSIQREEVLGLKEQLQDLRREVGALRDDSHRKEVAQAGADTAIQHHIQSLLDERKYTRTQLSALHELGTSLADIASFMHEVELKTGMIGGGVDSRGIDRLRKLALKLQPGSSSHDNEVRVYLWVSDQQ
ncbi:hypothetical protein JAAARDRAFT_28313 [Jaapia argillacea MUCL 33604]|uniref:Uncharacterized protein n=1 Tax=Jaapia argillacea MUCL 33604 TaxID=933084 RepID=A0A067QCI7_9AGAM|nr:hypothetical protein JAAARDRAFT_28313 [Jaapia argillacea MUCL 33604]